MDGQRAPRLNLGRGFGPGGGGRLLLLTRRRCGGAQVVVTARIWLKCRNLLPRERAGDADVAVAAKIRNGGPSTKGVQRSDSRIGAASAQDVLLPQRRIRSVLGFEDDGAGGEGVDGVPLTCGDVQGDGGAVGREFDGFNAGAGFVVKLFDQPAAENDYGFGGMPMPVNGQRAAGLDGIEHPLRLVLRRIAKVKIHPQPRRSLRLRSQIVKYFLSNLHIRSVMSNPADDRALSHLSATKGMIYLSRSFRGSVLADLREILFAKGMKRRPDSFRGTTHAAAVKDILPFQYFKRPDKYSIKLIKTAKAAHHLPALGDKMYL